MNKDLKQLPLVGIIGCGWLGLPLAIKLIKSGIQVSGTTTSSLKIGQLQTSGIQAELYNAAMHKVPEPILKTDVVVIAFPPKSKSTDGEWYWQSIKSIFDELANSNVKKVILLSSSSVYPDADQIYTEEFKLNNENTGNTSLLKAEEIAVRSMIPSFVLRLGGLAGGNRFLARHFSNKTGLLNGNAPVNLLHLDDAISIVESFVLKDFQPGIYNACSPIHPTKKELYSSDCQRYSLPLPEYKNEDTKGKEISSVKLTEATGYKFKFPDPMEYTYD